MTFEFVMGHNDYKYNKTNKLPNKAVQRIMVIGFANYAYLVPHVENEEELFLKTIIPSRKATQRYFGE